MSSKCTKCKQQSSNIEYLTCGHSLCHNCIQGSQFAQQFTVLCTQCSIMTVLRSNSAIADANPQNYVVCIQCRSSLMSTRQFLSSSHRKHQVVSVQSIVHDVHKNLRKYQLSFDLQNQALYNQAQLVSKQKKTLSDNYAKNLLSLRESFAQLKSSIQSCQQACIQNYQKIAIQAIQMYDHKIKEIKLQIFRCQSYVQAIQHCLIKNNYNKYVAAAQFYFKNINNLQTGLNNLIQSRTKTILAPQIGSFGNIVVPNLKYIQQINMKFKGLSDRILKQQHQEQKLKISKNSKLYQVQKNPQNQIQQYFDKKRKQIFNSNQINRITINTPNSQNQAKNSNSDLTNSSTNFEHSKQQPNMRDSYNIESRIQNLRKTLRLGQNKSQIKHSKSYAQFNFKLKQNK